MKNKYPNVNSNPDFSEISKQIIKFWSQQNIFEKSVESRPTSDEFIFFDGPPFANGLPHYGHILTGFVKDIVARYQTQKGKRVERVFGWDCHGLPAEMHSEKELGISGKLAIENFGIEKFNDHCKTSVLKFTNEWKDYVTNQGRWVDFENSYKTMDLNYMESVIWAFKQLYDKGLVYESMRVMPYSWACETPLSNFETRMDNSYRQRADKSVVVAFDLKQKPASAPDSCAKYRILAWTTTPWTLPSNLALAVGSEPQYYGVINNNNEYIIATEAALRKYYKDVGISEDAKFQKIPVSELVGLSYVPLFEYFANHENSFKILFGEFVLDGEGTGVVHMAPGFGEDDFNLCNANGIKIVCPVDDSGKFTSLVPDLEGLLVFDANDKIIIKLKEQASWIKTEQYLHNYPHCWRTDTPLIYKAVPSWYVKVTAIKEKMLKNNQQINWIPGHIKDGLFGKWLENANDWSISRNRFWGAPIPIWRSDNPQYPRVDVYGSIAELEADFGVKITDLHRPFIDGLTRPNPDDPTGKSTMRRINDVLDCWFESGSMPYAQIHYPFENKARFENYPSADFIVEYVAQTRGWFYTLMVLSTALFDKPPFLNCICHGVILDDQGQKLSKRLKNYIDPKEIFEKYGSDALRFLMASSAVMRGNEFFIDKEANMVKDVVRLTIKPLWNAYNFFCLYANSDGVEAVEITKSQNLNDSYILSKLAMCIKHIDESLSSYDLPSACNSFNQFIEVLNNWYIRRSRSRFWKSEHDDDKKSAYNTLYTVLLNLCKAIAPLLPIVTEEIYLGLTKGVAQNACESIHLTDFPDYKQFIINQNLITQIDKVQQICTAGLNIRNSKNIRIRQPLSKLTIIGKNFAGILDFANLIEDELNVKSVHLDENIENYAKETLKIIFPEVGKRIPAKVKQIIGAMKQNQWAKTSDGLIEVEGEKLLPNEFEITLDAFDKNNTATLPANNGIIILDLKLTKELELEGIARDVIRAIQQARKDLDLNVADRIKLHFKAEKQALEAISSNDAYIKEQVLATSISFELTGQEKVFAAEHGVEFQIVR